MPPYIEHDMIQPHSNGTDDTTLTQASISLRYGSETNSALPQPSAARGKTAPQGAQRAMHRLSQRPGARMCQKVPRGPPLGPCVSLGVAFETEAAWHTVQGFGLGPGPSASGQTS